MQSVPLWQFAWNAKRWFPEKNERKKNQNIVCWIFHQADLGFHCPYRPFSPASPNRPTLHTHWANLTGGKLTIFSYFSRKKKALTFHADWPLMKCQSLFCRKNNKYISNYRLLKILPGILRVNSDGALQRDCIPHSMCAKLYCASPLLFRVISVRRRFTYMQYSVQRRHEQTAPMAHWSGSSFSVYVLHRPFACFAAQLVNLYHYMDKVQQTTNWWYFHRNRLWHFMQIVFWGLRRFAWNASACFSVTIRKECSNCRPMIFFTQHTKRKCLPISQFYLREPLILSFVWDIFQANTFVLFNPPIKLHSFCYEQ